MELKSVNFRKPKIPALLREGFMCIDTHTHTNFSDGKDLSLMLKQCKKKGIGMAITDHNEIRGAVEALKQNEVPIIPGIEINSYDGPHFLCYFYNKTELEQFHERFIKPNKFFNIRGSVKLTLLEITEKLEDYNCVTCLPHPYGLLWASFPRAVKMNPENRRVIESVDGIEVISGLQRKIANKRAHELQVLFDKAPMAGSDAHGPSDLGNFLTLAKTSNVNDFLDAIRKKQTIAIGKEKIRQKAIHAGRMFKRSNEKIGRIIGKRLWKDEDI